MSNEVNTPTQSQDEKPVIPIPEDAQQSLVPEQARIENIFGMLIRVITTPTWVPRSFYEGFAVDTANFRFYWYDFTNAAWKYTTLENILAPGTSGNVITSNGSIWVSQAPISPNKLSITVTAAEDVSVGDVVGLYKAVGSYASGDAYGMVNGTVYAIRLAANDSTYSPNVLGIVTSAAYALQSFTVALVGDVTGLSGLTAGSKHYLDNYTSPSSNTITQSSQDATASITSGNSVSQFFVPTSDRIDKLILYMATNASAQVIVAIKRGNSTLASITTTFVGSIADRTFDFTDIRCYKGEILSILVTNDPGGPGGTVALGYKSGAGSGVYDPQYQGASLGSTADMTGSGVTIPSNSRMYFKLYEYTNFAKLSTSAGTRKIKIGNALSSTELLCMIQEGDSIL